MRLYEIVYVFDGDRTEEEVTAKIEEFNKLIVAGGGSVEAVDPWGVRQLAYPIKKHTRGFYAVAHVRATPDGLPEFERLVGFDPDVLRYLVVVNEGEPTTGLSVLVPKPERATEDDEDEDGEGPDDRDGDESDDGDDSPVEFSGGRGRRRRMDGPAVELLNYKDVATLSRFMTEQGKILPKRTTRVTAAFQRHLGSAVKRARFLGLIPYVSEQRP